MIEVVFFILFIWPFLVKYFHFFYFLQLNHYTLSWIREEFGEKIFKRVFLNFWTVIEIPFYLIALILYFVEKNAFEFIFTDLIFYYLMILNIYVLGKLFRGRILKPRFDARTLVWFLFLSSISWISFYYSSQVNLSIFYITLLTILIFPYFFIDIFYKLYRKWKNT